MEDRETTIRRVQGRILIEDDKDLGELTRALEDAEIPVEVSYAGSVTPGLKDSFEAFAIEMLRGSFAAGSLAEELNRYKQQQSRSTRTHIQYTGRQTYESMNSSSDNRAKVKQARKQAMKNKRKWK